MAIGGAGIAMGAASPVVAAAGAFTLAAQMAPVVTKAFSGNGGYSEAGVSLAATFLIPIPGAGKAAASVEKTVAKNVAKWTENAYSVVFETKLPTSVYPGLPRNLHFKEANRALMRELKNNQQFARSMDNLIPGIQEQLMGPLGGLSNRSPTGWTWHHSIDEGVMQLVPKAQHTAPGKIQSILHPGNKGGMATWGK